MNRKDLYTSLHNVIINAYNNESRETYELYESIGSEILEEYCDLSSVPDSLKFDLIKFNIKPEYITILQSNVDEDEFNEEEYDDEYTLNEGYDEEAVTYIKDVLYHGCISGACRSLIYYEDTERFFDEHADAILEILDNEIKETCGNLGFEINKNNLAWLAYEKVLMDFMYEIDHEW